MVYVPQTWQDAPSTLTPLTATELNRMEAGIVEGTQDASETQKGNVELASAAEMTAGTDLTRPPSVKRVADYVTTAVAGAGGAVDASETVKGIVELASAAEMTAGTDLTRPPSVKRVADYIATAISGVSGGSAPDASETVKGIVELASSAEMTAGTDLTRPPSVKRVFDYITSYVTSAISTKTPGVFNVKDPTYGAVGDDTADDTTAVNAAITAAAVNGGTVFFPPGTYSLNNVTWKAGVRYEGIRGQSILKIRTGAAYLGSCDSGSSSAFISKMTFTGLTFRGRIDTDTTFDQQRHLLNLNGVQSVLIWNCDFIGWHGDAIYLGSSNSGGTERHNRRVTIAFNLFDGLTKNNRNCVSIIDGEDIIVHGNVGLRFSRNDMPGFVDVEPNSLNGAFAICRRITVTNNETSDHNQNFFQMNLPSASYTNEIRDILVANNIDDAGTSNTNTRFTFMAFVRTATDASSFSNIKFVNNICRNVYCIVEIEGGVNGVDFFGNTFEDCLGAAIIGYWNATTRHIRFENNTFTRCGATDGNVFRLMYCNNISFVNNKWHSCVANLILFGLGESSIGTSTNIDWISNQVTGTGTTSISAKSSTHTLTAASNLRRPYRENGLTISTAHFGTLV